MFVLSYLGRVCWRRVIRRRKLKDVNKSSMIVVTEAENACHCLSEIAHNKYTDFKVQGVVVIDEDFSGQIIQGIPVVATADTLLSICAQMWWMRFLWMAIPEAVRSFWPVVW